MWHNCPSTLTSVKRDYECGVWPWNTNIWDRRIQKKEAVMGEECLHQVGDEQSCTIVQLPVRNIGPDSSWILFDITCQLKGAILKMHIATWCWGGTRAPPSYPVFSVAPETGPGMNMKPKWSSTHLCTWAYWESQTFVFPHVSVYSLVSFHVGKEKDGTFMHQTCKYIKVSLQRLWPTLGFPKTRRCLQWNSRWQQNPQQVLLLPLLSDRGRWALRRAAEESGPFLAGPERPSLPAALEHSHLSRARRAGHVWWGSKEH